MVQLSLSRCSFGVWEILGGCEIGPELAVTGSCRFSEGAGDIQVILNFNLFTTSMFGLDRMKNNNEVCWLYMIVNI